MNLSDLLKPDAVLPSLHAQSKKQVLQEVAGAAARLTGRGEREIFDTLLQRERLGSTGVGSGRGHTAWEAQESRSTGRGVRAARAAGRLRFGRRPAGRSRVRAAGAETAGADHLKALARIARVLRDPAMAQKLRAALDADGIYAILTGLDEASHAA